MFAKKEPENKEEFGEKINVSKMGVSYIRDDDRGGGWGVGGGKKGILNVQRRKNEVQKVWREIKNIILTGNEVGRKTERRVSIQVGVVCCEQISFIRYHTQGNEEVAVCGTK